MTSPDPDRRVPACPECDRACQVSNSGGHFYCPVHGPVEDPEYRPPTPVPGTNPYKNVTRLRDADPEDYP